MTKEEIKQKNWDSYLYKDTNILINNFNIIDQEKLKEKEYDISFKKLLLLNLNPIKGNFDSTHLCDIHNFIFNEIYPFSGKYRICTLQKDTMFCEPEFIEEYLSDCLNRMNEEIKNIYYKDELAMFLANYYYELIYIHPFREGNGRTIRLFIKDFVNEKTNNKYDIDYTKMNKENMLVGTKFKYLYPSMLEMEFRNGLVVLENDKKI